MTKEEVKKGCTLYYARIPTFDVCEILIRTVEETYFVGIDKRDKKFFFLDIIH